MSLLGAFLAAALVLSYRFPVHIGRATKICMGSVALYLMATLLVPTVASIAACLGVLGGEWMMRKERGLLASDMATDAGRWTVIVLAGSLVAHDVPPGGAAHVLAIVAAGTVLWAGDMLSSPLILYPITNEAPARTISNLVREGGLTEAYQYLIGLLGALAAVEQRWAVALVAVPIIPLHLSFRSAKETQDSTRQVLEAMADAVDLRDPYTGGHSQRVASYAARVLDALGLHGAEVELIIAAARVHDIGKIGTPDSVLLKDGKLTDEERGIMEQHPAHGAALLVRYKDFRRGAAIVRAHHERWDGQGYPDGLKADEIPFGARILAVADSFDAMTSDRPYRRGMGQLQATAILKAGSGAQWDPVMVDALLRSLTDQPQARAPAPRFELPAAIGAKR